MNRMHLIALAACLLVSSVLAAAGRRGPQSTQEMLQQQQDLMIKECRLSEDQQKAVKEKFKAKQDVLEKWEKANAEKLAAADAAAKAARSGTDEAAKKKANDDRKALIEDRTRVTAEADKAIVAVLTDDQKITWAGVQLAETTLPRYRKASLSDEQVAKIKSACALAAKDLAGFTGDDKKDKQGRATIQKSLKWAIDNVILTPEQRAIMAPPARKAPAK